MTEDNIKRILEQYGLRRILSDNRISLVQMLDVLESLGYINLEMYLIDDEGDYYEDF